MCHGNQDSFMQERERLNDTVMKYAGKTTRRIYSLDNQTYREGALSGKEKELLGLVASLVLRCDDCVHYHLARCHEVGVKDEELAETMDIGLLVGGTITVPHIRRAFDTWDGLKKPMEECGHDE
jgi:AhpD family alkylhydroperoxidase